MADPLPDPRAKIAVREFGSLYRLAVGVDRRSFPVAQTIRKALPNTEFHPVFSAARAVVDVGAEFAHDIHRSCPWVMSGDLFVERKVSESTLFHSVCVGYGSKRSEDGSI